MPEVPELSVLETENSKFSQTQIFASLYSGSFRFFFFFIFQSDARITVTQALMIIGTILKIRILLLTIIISTVMIIIQ